MMMSSTSITNDHVAGMLQATCNFLQQLSCYAQYCIQYWARAIQAAEMHEAPHKPCDIADTIGQLAEPFDSRTLAWL